MKPIYDIKARKDVIESLIDIYTAISVQIETNENGDLKERNKINELHDKTKKGIENYLERIEDEFGKIEFLRTSIEDIIIPEDKEENEMDFFKEYYNRLIEKLEELPLVEKNEKILLDFIKESQVKIYEDKREKEQCSYGQFTKEQGNMNNKSLYKDENMELIRLSTYKTRKNKKENNIKRKNLIRLETEEIEINKYEYKLRYEKGKIAAIEFFGDSELGKRIEKGNLKYIGPMLAAIELAKRNGREYIGKIEMIDKDLQTFVTQYDDELENRVKELIEKEEKDKNNITKVSEKDKILEEQ